MEVLKAWAAGIFEGEGSIHVSASRSLLCSVGNEDPCVIKALLDKWGGHVSIRPKGTKAGSSAYSSDYYVLSFRLDEARRFLSDILPYAVGGKKAIAAEIVRCIESGLTLPDIHLDGFSEEAKLELWNVASVIGTPRNKVGKDVIKSVDDMCGLEEALLIRVLAETNIKVGDIPYLRSKDVLTGRLSLSPSTLSMVHRYSNPYLSYLFPSLSTAPRSQAGWYVWAKVRAIGAKLGINLLPSTVKGVLRDEL